jgi:uncharacterized protein
MNLAALVVGLIFGLGLAISGMLNPAKVMGFLDLAGAWDPTLAVVMAAGLGVNALAYRLTTRRAKPVLAAAFQVPTRKDIDVRLVLGSAIFGVGWGIAGICPGPALASLGAGAWSGGGFLEPGILIFVAAMLAGMGLFSLIERAGTPAR